MSSDAFDHIVKKSPELLNVVLNLENYLSKQDTGRLLAVDKVASWVDCEPVILEGVFEVLIAHKLLKKLRHDECQTCGEIGKKLDGKFFCDICGKYEGEVLFKKENYYQLRRPIIKKNMSVKDSGGSEMISVKNNETLKRNRVRLWDASLRERDFIVDETRLGDIAIKHVLTKVEEYGICLLRLAAEVGQPHVLKSLEKAIGPACKEQNDWDKDTIKPIEPKASGNKGSGDTTSDLGFHVDGTQHQETPAFLLFQYLQEASVGAESVFVDMTQALMRLTEQERNAIVVNLSRKDAARFKKVSKVEPNGYRTFEGPIFKVVRGEVVAIRIRFDEIIKVHKDCEADFEKLRSVVCDENLILRFRPRENDIVIFDNWRLLHARDEVYGNLQRRHNRMWLKDYRENLKADRTHGIRVFDSPILSAIKSQSAG